MISIAPLCTSLLRGAEATSVPFLSLPRVSLIRRTLRSRPPQAEEGMIRDGEEVHAVGLVTLREDDRLVFTRPTNWRLFLVSNRPPDEWVLEYSIPSCISVL